MQLGVATTISGIFSSLQSLLIKGSIFPIDFSSPFPPCKNNNKGKFEFDSSYPSGKIKLYLIGLGIILDSSLNVEYFFIIHFTFSYLTILTLFFPFNSISFSPMLAILRDNSEIFHFSYPFTYVEKVSCRGSLHLEGILSAPN